VKCVPIMVVLVDWFFVVVAVAFAASPGVKKATVQYRVPNKHSLGSYVAYEGFRIDYCYCLSLPSRW